MITLGTYLKIGNYRFATKEQPRGIVNNIEVETGWDSFTDNISITIPKKLFYKGIDDKIQPVINPSTKQAIFERGQEIIYGVTYNGVLTEHFRGVVTGVQPKRPMVIQGEDAMWNLKQKIITKYSKLNTTLPEVLDAILPAGTVFQCEDLKFGDFRVPGRLTVVQVLEWMKKTYGMSSFINRDGRLIVGFPYLTELQADIRTAGNPATQPVNDPVPEPIIIQYGKNLIDDSSLSYVRSDDMKIQLKIIVIHEVGGPYHPGPNTKKQRKTEYIYGDPDGALRTLHAQDIPKSTADVIGDEKIQEFKYDGFRGRLTTFLVPKIHPGDTVRVIHEDIVDQEGVYWVKRVTRSYGMDGGRQVVELDRRVT